MKRLETYVAAVLVSIITLSCGHDAETLPSDDLRKASSAAGVYYQVGVGDILEVMTWKEPDFTRDVHVRMDGKISFPLLQDIQASGRQPAEISNEIENKLKDFVTHPVVMVSVKAADSQKFYIIGEVLKPGEYPLTKNLTVLQALALSGGFTEWAAKSDILLVRNENGVSTPIHVNYKDMEGGEGLHQNIQLKADDILLVP